MIGIYHKSQGMNTADDGRGVAKISIEDQPQESVQHLLVGYCKYIPFKVTETSNQMSKT